MWLLACSGPGAPATIGRNIAFAERQAIVVAVLTAASLLVWVPFNRRIRYPAVCLAPLSFHPAWSMSAVKGDCGYGMAENATYASLIAVGTVVLQARYAVRVWRSRSKLPGQDFA